MRIEELITNFQETKKSLSQQSSQVIIYDPKHPPKIERAKGDTRVLFLIPDNGRDAKTHH